MKHAQPAMLMHALKEWAVVVAALERGDQILLLRKGGLRDPLQSFALPDLRMALFPTPFHQAQDYLKRPADFEILTEPSNLLRFSVWAEATHCLALRSPAEVEALRPFYLWNERFV